jgi:hypothetical protein
MNISTKFFLEGRNIHFLFTGLVLVGSLFASVIGPLVKVDAHKYLKLAGKKHLIRTTPRTPVRSNYYDY